jgi:peptide/nickel transport system substrate-binding protein
VRLHARQFESGILLAVLLLTACAGPSSSSTAPAVGTETRRATPKRIVGAILGEPFTFSAQLNTAAASATVRGIDELEQLMHAGLAIADNQGGLRPQLAEAVPTVENGLWKVFPDGKMETTWKLRPNAKWQDGAPLTSEDLLFTLQVGRDRDLAAFRNRALDQIEGVEAPDPQTIRVRWSQPFISADTLFAATSDRIGMPLPKHLLEKAYSTDKASFLQVPYWTDEFVGAGPFKLGSWVRESHLILSANPDYVLGRPAVDEIEVRFVLEQNVMIANILAGAVELTIGRTIGLDQAVQIRDSWKDGKLDMAPDSWLSIFPQLLSPSPAVVGDVAFRKALVHAIDRQAMVDSIQSGLSEVAHSFMQPNQAIYRDIETQQVVRYEYDARRASQMIESLGLQRGSDGKFRDASGQRLPIELRASATDLNQKVMLSVADYWQKVGVDAEPLPIPRQLASDNEYRATFPAFEVTRRSNDTRALGNLYGSQVPTAANNFTGSNNGRYASPELDALLDSYFSAITQRDRLNALGQILHHLSDRVIVLGIFYDPQPVLVGSRLRNVGAKPTPLATQAWNAEKWDVQ